MTIEQTKSVFNENAQHVLRERYFYKYPDHQETEEEFFDRVSMGNPEYREMLSSLDFLPNSPTLFNIGIPGAGTFSACFKFDVADTMESPDGNGIMDVATKAAAVLKWGGGVGYSVHVRPKGAPVSTTHGKAMGPLAVFRHYDSVSRLVTQGGKRDGAQMGILHCDHDDVFDFIHMKDETAHLPPDDPRSLSTFNISVALTDELMHEAVSYVNDPNDLSEHPRQYRLLREMAESAWRTGDPGCFFIDAAERGNPTPWLGKLTGTNPCGEVPLLDNEPCNLGSLNLANFVVDNPGSTGPTNARVIDLDRLRERAALATAYLDDVLDRNTFPHPAVEKAARTTRKLGLGVMGYADALALMGIHYDSEEALRVGEEIASTIWRAALEQSLELTESKGGHAPAYDLASDHERAEVVRKYGGLPRNATRTCIAPTGTISLIAGASGGIEPHFSLEWTRRLGDGTILQERAPVMDRLPEGFTPKTALEIDWRWHIRHQAVWQKWTDLAVSKTVNMPNDATVEDVFGAYVMLWESGCKGGTIYRTGSRSIETLVVKQEEPAAPTFAVGASGRADVSALTADAIARGAQHELPTRRNANTRKFVVGGVKGYMTVGEYDDGRPGELFLNVTRRGSTEDGLYDIIATQVSIALQYGVPLSDLVKKFVAVRFEPSGLTSDPEIPTATSIIDYVFRRLDLDYGNGTAAVVMDSGMRCPECASGVVYEEGCMKCAGQCGWSRCG